MALKVRVQSDEIIWQTQGQSSKHRKNRRGPCPLVFERPVVSVEKKSKKNQIKQDQLERADIRQGESRPDLESRSWVRTPDDFRNLMARTCSKTHLRCYFREDPIGFFVTLAKLLKNPSKTFLDQNPDAGDLQNVTGSSLYTDKILSVVNYYQQALPTFTPSQTKTYQSIEFSQKPRTQLPVATNWIWFVQELFPK